MRAPAAHVCGLGSCPDKLQQRVSNHKKDTQFLIPGHWTMRTTERQCFNYGSHFGCVVGVSSGTRESEMSLGGDDGTKHDINPSMVRSCNHTSSSEGFAIHDAYPVCINGPSSEIIASFTCFGTSIGNGYLALGFGRRKFFQDSWHAS